jgi:hypothetical protein
MEHIFRGQAHFSSTAHLYTRLLLDAIAVPDPSVRAARRAAVSSASAFGLLLQLAPSTRQAGAGIARDRWRAIGGV